MKKWIVILVLLFGWNPFLMADIVYVKNDAAGTGDGSSWANAFTELQPAIDSASVGDKIWVAAATYYPTSWPNGGSTNRERHFSMKNGVSIYGGFVGTETQFSERNVRVNETILSGDFNNNDADLDSDGFEESNRDENAYQIFYHPNGVNLDNAASIDGFTITSGNANGSFPYQNGGAFYNGANSSPTIINSTFQHNFASFSGGAICSASSEKIIHCTFIYNSAERGGAIDIGSSLTITNCSFAYNSAEKGGAINNLLASPVITNSTFSFNSATEGGAFYAVDESTFVPITVITIKNCIFWSNTPSEIPIENHGISMSHCIIQGGFFGLPDIIDQDPLLKPLGDYGGSTPTMPISMGSPAIEAGTIEPSTNGIEIDFPKTDQRGFTRIGLPDIGACEYQPLTSTKIGLFSSPQISIEIPTELGIPYQLQTSSNLTDWNSWVDFSGTGSTESHSFDTTGQPIMFFRTIVKD